MFLQNWLQLIDYLNGYYDAVIATIMLRKLRTFTEQLVNIIISYRFLIIIDNDNVFMSG